MTEHHATGERPRGPEESPGWRPSPAAILLLAAPGIAVLAGLAVFGELAFGAALVGLFVLLGATAVLAARHLGSVRRLRHRVEAYGHDGKPQPSHFRRGADSVLLPGLEAALGEAAEERRRARRSLETATASNETILAALPDPLIMLDRRRRIVRLNAAAQELFGTASEGRDLTDVLRAPALLEAADEVLAGLSSRLVEFSIPGPLQSDFSARVERLPSETADSTVAILALHDLTSVKRAEQLRVDFVANASHELRTPLSSLLGFIETLRGPARDDEEARHRFLAIMHDQALRMTRLVEDLLSLSRIEMKEHTMPTGRTDLDRLVRSVASSLEPPASEKGMTLEVAVGPLPPVAGDQDELAQVFQNLIDNAIKYGRPGTPVRVVAGDSLEGQRRLGLPAVAISVIDRGDGIAREHLTRLTERFYRVDKARSRQLGGTGLGLAIAKHIINRHRGALDIQSAEGEGSTFTVVLPAAESQASEPAEAGKGRAAE